MSPTKWLNHFLFLECVLGIYRNYCRQKKTKKFFIILQIFVQMTLHGLILINEETFLLGGKGIDANKLAHGAFSAVSFCNSFSAVTISLCYSNVFMCFVRSFSRVFEYFREDSFIHDLKKIYWFSVISTIICIPFSFYRSLEILINEIQMEGDTDMFILISVFTSQALIRFMIVFEKILFFFVIMIVVQLVKCLKSAISTVQARIGRCEISFNEQRVLTREQIQGWVELYRDLANCCEKLTLCFGRQVLNQTSLRLKEDFCFFDVNLRGFCLLNRTPYLWGVRPPNRSFKTKILHVMDRRGRTARAGLDQKKNCSFMLI